MIGKTTLGFKIIYPFIINVILFYSISEYDKISRIEITDTLLVLGILNLIYGLGSLFIIKRPGYFYIKTKKVAAVNLALADPYIENYHTGDGRNFKQALITKNHIKVIYVFLGVLLCVAAFIV